MTTGLKIGLFACRRGASAVEMALVFTIFLGLLFGIINFSLVLWTQASLHYAVQAAARFASINAPTAPDLMAATRAYALSKYYGQDLGDPDVFDYLPGGCGHTVKTRQGLTYNMTIPFYGTYPVPLSATACFP